MLDGIERRNALGKIKKIGLLSIASFSVLGAENIKLELESEFMKQHKNERTEYDSHVMFLPKKSITFDKKHIALLVINPQNDFLSPSGVGWKLYGASIKENNTIKNIISLIEEAQASNVTTFISTRIFEEEDYVFLNKTPFNNFMSNNKMLLKNSVGSAILEEIKQYTNKSINLTPLKSAMPTTNDLMMQLSGRNIKQVIICGMDSNVHVESHVRYLVDIGYEIIVARDAIAGAKIKEGNGYSSSETNFKYIANDILNTKEILQKLTTKVFR